MANHASARVRLSNERGLHARPCSSIVAIALKHQSRLRVRCEGREVDGRSILSLMTLGASVGTELEFEAQGEDAEALIARLSDLVRAGFEETD